MAEGYSEKESRKQAKANEIDRMVPTRRHWEKNLQYCHNVPKMPTENENLKSRTGNLAELQNNQPALKTNLHLKACHLFT